MVSIDSAGSAQPSNNNGNNSSSSSDFTAFLSASDPNNAPANLKTEADAGEKDFFSQPAPADDGSSKAKNTKDSIMALFNQAPPSQNGQSAAFGAHHQQQQQQPMQFMQSTFQGNQVRRESKFRSADNA